MRRQKERRVYKRSVEEIRASHPRLYSQRTHVHLVRNAVLGTPHAVTTCTLRVRATADAQIACLRNRLARTLARLYAELGEQPVFEATLTANFLLERTDDSGRVSYCVFYGQSYGAAERDFESRNLPGGSSLASAPGPWPVVLRDVGDVCQIPEVVTPNDVLGEYDRTFDDSSVTVHSIINYVVILRSVHPNFYRRQSSGGTLSGAVRNSSRRVNRVLRVDY